MPTAAERCWSSAASPSRLPLPPAGLRDLTASDFAEDVFLQVNLMMWLPGQKEPPGRAAFLTYQLRKQLLLAHQGPRQPGFPRGGWGPPSITLTAPLSSHEMLGRAHNPQPPFPHLYNGSSSHNVKLNMPQSVNLFCCDGHSCCCEQPRDWLPGAHPRPADSGSAH